MQFKITVELPSEISSLIVKALGKLQDAPTTAEDKPTVATRPTTPPKKPAAAPAKGKGKAVKEPEPVEEPEEEPQEETDEPSEDFDEPAEAEEPTEEAEDELVTAEEQKKLKAALRAYSDKTTRQAAAAILLKYGKTSGDVKQKDLPKLLKALKV